MSQPGLIYEMGLFIYNFCWGLFSQALNKIGARHQDAMQILRLKQHFATRMSKALKRKNFKKGPSNVPQINHFSIWPSVVALQSPPIGFAARHFCATIPIPSCLCSTEGCGLFYRKTDKNVRMWSNAVQLQFSPIGSFLQVHGESIN